MSVYVCCCETKGAECTQECIYCVNVCVPVLPHFQLLSKTIYCLQYASKNSSKIVPFCLEKCTWNQSATLTNDVPNRSHTVLFHSISFGTVLYTPWRIAQSPTALLFVGEKLLCWSACCLTATFVYSGSLLVANRSFMKPFPKGGIAPAHWMASALELHCEGMQTKQNGTGD